MAHQIEQHDTILSVRETPWHKLGTVIPSYVGPAEAARLGGLDWVAEEAPVEFSTGDLLAGTHYQHPARSHKVIYRTLLDGTPLTLGVVGQHYRSIQPAEMLETLEALIAESGEQLRIETCGTLRNSKVGWFQAVTPGSVMIADDPHIPYLLCANSWDSSGSMILNAGKQRVVCANTLAWSLARAQTSFSIRPPANAMDRVKQAREALQLVAVADAEFQAEVQALIGVPITRHYFDWYVETLFPSTPTASDQTLRNVTAQRDAVRAIWEDPNGPVAHIKDTRYGALMAASDYELWSKRRKNRAEAQALSVIRGQQPILARARSLIGH